MKRLYWFKAHKSGYGWYPSSWQGWVVLLSYILFLFISFNQMAPISRNFINLLENLFPRFFMATVILTILTYLKGESITWGLKGRKQHEIP